MDEVDANLNWHLIFARALRVIDAILLGLVFVVQNTYLNFTIVELKDGYPFYYFTFLIDFVVLILFIYGITVANRFYQKGGSANLSNTIVPEVPDHSITNFIKFPAKMGTLPLIYLSWILYSVVLVTKLFVMFHLEYHVHTRSGETEFYFDSSYLVVALGCSAIVFLLWVEAHRNVEDPEQSNFCLKELCATVVFEIFDAVTFLDLLVQVARGNRPGLAFEMITIALVSSNLLLPSLGLYRLSQANFDYSNSGYGLSLIQHLCKIFLVNIPYLCIRLDTWTNGKAALSVFVIKNVLGIMVSLRLIVPELRTYWKSTKQSKVHHANQNVAISLLSQKARSDNSIGDKFEEVHLNDQSHNGQA